MLKINVDIVGGMRKVNFMNDRKPNTNAASSAVASVVTEKQLRDEVGECVATRTGRHSVRLGYAGCCKCGAQSSVMGGLK